MKKINVPTAEQVAPESQEIFAQLTKRLGKVPNLYATIGYSGNALKGFLDFEATLNKGSFSAKEREAIALVVSEVNHCDYCLAAHTQAALKYRFTLEETLDFRRGSATDDKLNAIVQLAKAIAESKGHPDAALVDNFYTAGFKEDGLIELIGLVTVRIFTNYVFAATQIPVDYPAAPKLV
ncbi:carboxymuconolactone decarboxylase family protein [Adhaeribacter radiodurans]|uniref:Carboxymuconolactone decarboxylase family protein n=1 Tax=Adhaeribacter radiodurans TaxID=2745197 RepID=A0A7L7L1N6_9BACT|nr:carboxymuconolactone decarboxylase family protein [Adhaeribacter radiodurans]QMU26701.1 carboxymuconolactone decarboxylase family protein [Adhaeribacter radiodurans]